MFQLGGVLLVAYAQLRKSWPFYCRKYGVLIPRVLADYVSGEGKECPERRVQDVWMPLSMRKRYFHLSADSRVSNFFIILRNSRCKG